jgi:hypothetical protein
MREKPEMQGVAREKCCELSARKVLHGPFPDPFLAFPRTRLGAQSPGIPPFLASLAFLALAKGLFGSWPVSAKTSQRLARMRKNKGLEDFSVAVERLGDVKGNKEETMTNNAMIRDEHAKVELVAAIERALTAFDTRALMSFGERRCPCCGGPLYANDLTVTPEKISDFNVEQMHDLYVGDAQVADAEIGCDNCAFGVIHWPDGHLSSPQRPRQPKPVAAG